MNDRPRSRLDLYRKQHVAGRGWLVRSVWYLTNAIFFKSSWWVCPGMKSMILKLFGAKVGKGVIIKPSVNIKYPWKLLIGDHVWVGENVWIDNLAEVRIGNHVCLSQGCFLETGNHDYTSPTFDLMTGPIFLEDGCWVGAKAVVCPGVRLGSHSVLTVGSVAVSDLEPYMIYQGNPAVPVKKRIINTK